MQVFYGTVIDRNIAHAVALFTIVNVLSCITDIIILRVLKPLRSLQHIAYVFVC